MSDLYPDQVSDILTRVKMSRVDPCGGIWELRELGMDERDAEAMVLAAMAVDVNLPVIATHGNHRDPFPARVICTDLKGRHPIAAALLMRNGREKVFAFDYAGNGPRDEGGYRLTNGVEGQSDTTAQAAASDDAAALRRVLREILSHPSTVHPRDGDPDAYQRAIDAARALLGGR